MARRRTELDFPSVKIEGALFPGDFLARIAHFGAPEQSEGDYRIPKKLRLRDELGRYFRIAEGLWQDFQSAPAGKGRDARKVTVDAFQLPFLRQVLGFDDVVPVGTMERDGRHFPVGHTATSGRTPLILAARDEDLDEPAERYGDDHRRRSPFLLAQEYLNAGAALWAIVSNGKVLRVLRGNPSLTRPAYLEFDLERLFEERLYPDFAVLWLACHASRFGTANAAPSDCALERWKSAAQQEGTRARERLRFGVADALRELGTGFLSVPGNTALRERIEKGELSSEAFYQQLLRLIYRLLFLFTVEERGLIHPPTASKEAIELYRHGYSLGQLRALAAKRRRFDRHHDLWQALSITFSGLGKGEAALGLPGLGGLFHAGQCPDIDSANLPNRSLLEAIYKLAYFIEAGALVRVNYRDMGSEELGSIYEALLELVPEIDTASHPWRFRFVGDDAPAGEGAVAGNARKLTGSYYTPDTLVQELIKSALEPIIADRRKKAADSEKALLGIKVLDPACGSGHFLLAAARKLAENLARIRAVEGEPRPDDYRRALRDVVSHCIYGVDRNPLALELARTALWLESFSPDRPLSFLDHHLRCGDALIGAHNPAIMEDGIPEEAFRALSGDDREVMRELNKKNTAARKGLAKEKERLTLMQELTVYEAEGGRVLDAMPEESIDEVEAKREAFERAHEVAVTSKARRLADCFIAAFFVTKTKDSINAVPTTEDFHRIVRDVPPRPGVEETIRAANQRAQAFHWHLEFADVIRLGGFDVLLGNPPWERIKLQEEEFFATRSPDIANARNKAERGRLIQRLPQGDERDRALFEAFIAARRTAEAASVFAHHAGRFPLTGVGDVNTYALFAETFVQLRSTEGRAGFVVPTGIATDETTKEFFGYLITHSLLVSLLDFRTGAGLFADIGHQRYKFCLLTLGKSDAPHFVFFALQVDDIHDERRHFTLTAPDFELMNPNSLTCPVFRTERDAELTRRIYRKTPILIRDMREGHPEVNPWKVRFMRMFDMSGDSGMFMSEPGSDRLPLYEAKLAHHFDHRWATYDEQGDDSRDCTLAEKTDAAFAVRSRYFVDEREVGLRTAILPKGLMDALRERNRPAIVLMIAHLLFAKWLRELGLTTKERALTRLFPEWKRFAEHHRFALRIAPTQLGLCGSNPACTKPQGPEYLCAEPIDEIKLGQRERAAWYSADNKCVGSFLEVGERYKLSAPESALACDEDALEFAEQCLEKTIPRWLMGFRDICRATDERTVIAVTLPRAGVGHTLPLFFSECKPVRCAALVANLNSLILDFVARQKLGGTHLTYGYLKQLPVLPPDAYSDEELEFITQRVLELSYTAVDLREWAEDLGYSGHPYAFDTARRALLRAELDAFYARLYGLNRDELRYVLDPADVMGPDYPSETFRVLRKNEEREFGEYRTRRLVMDAWDRLDQGRIAAPRPTTARQVALPVGAWARPMSDERAESGAVLAAILKAMPGAMPARQVRLAATLALQPRLLPPYLTATEASTWRRLIGPEADALPHGTATVIPRVDGAWGAAVRTLRTSGSLVEAAQTGMWAPGANVDALETAGWPDGRARFVLTVLERQATDAIVRELPTSLRDWIDAQAA